jgi:hypothetical protein
VREYWLMQLATQLAHSWPMQEKERLRQLDIEYAQERLADADRAAREESPPAFGLPSHAHARTPGVGCERGVLYCRRRRRWRRGEVSRSRTPAHLRTRSRMPRPVV